MESEKAGAGKILKSCDACKARKVRCSSPGYPGPCKNCTRRNTACHFSIARAPRRHKADSRGCEERARGSSSAPLESLTVKDETSDSNGIAHEGSPVPDSLQRIYVDHLLARSWKPGGRQDRLFPFKGNGIFGGNYSLSFFSDSRMSALAACLQNSKVNDLVGRVAEVINARLQSSPQSPNGSILRRAENIEAAMDQNVASVYVKAYFEKVHPFYPFLDRSAFEQTISNPSFSQGLQSNKALSALYHSVLAMGCQCSGYGTFEPGKGRSWQLFSVSLALFSDLLTLPDSLLTLQALTAMAIFALGISCLQIEHLIISEAARRAQNITFSRHRDVLAHTYSRTFWVLYSVEKTASFYFGRSSVFNDFDIAHPIPSVSEAFFGDYDWFLAFARNARLLSRAYTSLFSVGVTGHSRRYFTATIDQLFKELEQWRMSIPETIRPGTAFWERILPGPLMTPVALWTHYLYYGLLLALSRAKLHLESRSEEASSQTRQQETKKIIMRTSRSILELTRFVDVEPYTPVWVLAAVPLAALFVLFDLVIHNPRHPETGSNLALLHIASGHFSRIEYASGGSVPSSMISEFAFIATEYVREVQHRSTESQNPGNSSAWPNLPLTGSHDLDVCGGVGGTGASTVSGSLGSGDAGAAGVGAGGAGIGPPVSAGVGAPMEPSSQPQYDLMQMLDTNAGPQASESAEALFYPLSDDPYYTHNDVLMGTDIMDLFGSVIPGFDPNYGAWNGVGGKDLSRVR